MSTKSSTDKVMKTISDVMKKYLDVPKECNIDSVIDEFKNKHPGITDPKMIKQHVNTEKELWQAKIDVGKLSTADTEGSEDTDNSLSETSSASNDQSDTTKSSVDDVPVKKPILKTSKKNIHKMTYHKSLEKYKNCLNRLASFPEVWTFDDDVNPIELAKAGFYYMGYADNVKCFSCNLVLSEWTADDDPMDEHYKHSPKCAYINAVYLPREIRYLEKDTDADTISDIKIGDSVSALFKSIANHIDKITNNDSRYERSFLPSPYNYVEECTCPECVPESCLQCAHNGAKSKNRKQFSKGIHK